MNPTSQIPRANLEEFSMYLEYHAWTPSGRTVCHFLNWHNQALEHLILVLGEKLPIVHPLQGLQTALQDRQTVGVVEELCRSGCGNHSRGAIPRGPPFS